MICCRIHERHVAAPALYFLVGIRKGEENKEKEIYNKLYGKENLKKNKYVSDKECRTEYTPRLLSSTNSLKFRGWEKEVISCINTKCCVALVHKRDVVDSPLSLYLLHGFLNLKPLIPKTLRSDEIRRF